MLHIGAGVPSNSTSVKRGQRGLLFLVTRASGTNLKWAGKWSTLGANGMVKVELSRIACDGNGNSMLSRRMFAFSLIFNCCFLKPCK